MEQVIGRVMGQVIRQLMEQQAMTQYAMPQKTTRHQPIKKGSIWVGSQTENI
jgi:hypothetical protein